jgi:hypothetical protein
MTTLHPDNNYNSVVTYNDGTQIKVYSSQLVTKQLNQFQGWQCDAGCSRIFILPDTSVFGSECENDYLGKLSDNSFEILSQKTVCKKSACYNNPDDLMVEKIKFSKNITK